MRVPAPAAGAHGGFTLVELVAVIAIIGVLAVAAAPRFFASNTFAERGFADQSRAVIAYAHKHAVASGCDVRVRFSAAGYSIERWASCVPPDHSAASSVIAAPGGGSLSGQPADGVAVTSLDFFFDKLGRPRTADAAAVLIGNPLALRVTVGAVTLQVEPETGFVRSL